jgi:predicted ATPase
VSSFTPRAWKSQPSHEAGSVAPPAEDAAPRDAVKSNNLPIASTAFIGRERDVADVKELLDRHRLVTLVGSGGVGKTRLAIAVGSELLSEYPDGVWMVDLAPVGDPELVSSVTAQALGMRQQEGRRVDEAIPEWLERKKLLLIFDNCEHVVGTIVPIAAAILRVAPDVRILATSRQALDIGGEAVARIPSLDVPRTIADLTAAAVVEFAAVALFVARATLADRSFALTDDTAPIVADICRRLDGIPLAIELAAARVKVLSIPHLAERLNERFKILTGGSRDALPRQKTLSALLDWSYDLLSPQEQLLFARLGVFAGGFGLDAATNVCSGDGLDEIDILDLLASLTDKSLVVADTSGERERYRLLESTAAYALEKLSASGERESAMRRHAEYFRDQIVVAGDRVGQVGPAVWVGVAELELDNLRAALAWALTHGNDAVVGAAIAGEVPWPYLGLTVEGRYWIDLALERLDEAEEQRIAARLHEALSLLSSGKRKYDEAERSMQLSSSVGDGRGAARAQVSLAAALFQMGRLDEAQAAVEHAVPVLRACGDAWHVANGLNVQGVVAFARGDIPAARELFAQSLAAFRMFGGESGAALVLSNLAELEFSAGNPEQALSATDEALALLTLGKNVHSIAIGHVNIAAYRIALGDLSGARESAREGLRLGRQARFEPLIATALQHLAVLAGLGGDARRAALLRGYVDSQLAALGVQRQPTEQHGYDQLMTALRDALSEDEIATLAAEGAAWSEDRAVEEALKV